MQRLKGRSIVLVALAALACSGDPTGNEGTPTAITANPDVVFVTQGDSQAVLVSVIDEERKARTEPRYMWETFTGMAMMHERLRAAGPRQAGVVGSIVGYSLLRPRIASSEHPEYVVAATVVNAQVLIGVGITTS